MAFVTIPGLPWPTISELLEVYLSTAPPDEAPQQGQHQNVIAIFVTHYIFGHEDECLHLSGDRSDLGPWCPLEGKYALHLNNDFHVAFLRLNPHEIFTYKWVVMRADFLRWEEGDEHPINLTWRPEELKEGVVTIMSAWNCIPHVDLHYGSNITRVLRTRNISYLTEDQSASYLNQETTQQETSTQGNQLMLQTRNVETGQTAEQTVQKELKDTSQKTRRTMEMGRISTSPRRSPLPPRWPYMCDCRVKGAQRRLEKERSLETEGKRFPPP